MALATVVDYNPTNKTVTIAGDIASAQLLSIVNQTAITNKDIFVVGQTAITNRVYSGGNTTFSFAGITTTGHNANDILAVRYQASISTASLPDGVIIGSTAYFNRNTVPTTRIDGSALQDGDTWYDPSAQRSWSRKGIYWVGQRKQIAMGTGTSGFYFTLNAASGSGSWRVTIPNPSYLYRFVMLFYCSGATNLSNYWSLTNLRYTVGDSVAVPFSPATLDINNFYVGEHRQISLPIETAIFSPLNTGLAFSFTRIGTVALSGILTGFMEYAEIYV